MRELNAHLTYLGAIFAALLLLASCRPESVKSLGDAYVAPASLNLRSTLTTKSTTAAVLKHGDHLSVMDVKRRYVKVRTDNGIEGWLDSRQLLSKEQMDQLRDETRSELRLPSQGRATTFDVLNMHIDPDRHSPALAQIAAGGTVDVLAHKAVPRALQSGSAPAPSFLKPPAPAPKRAKKPKPQKNLPLKPPMPPPPKPPANWQDLSSERINGPTRADEQKERQAQLEAQKAAEAEAAAKKPVILEDWTLVRTTDKKVGWVLARNLYMSIPDDVAQYAEGQRITSYFELGAVHDEEKGTRHNWLWTTSSKPQNFDFDRFRVFIWNRRRHRFETSFRQKDLVGYFPVEVEPAHAGEVQRRFSLILQDENGKLWKKRYVFDGTRVRLAMSEPYQPAENSGPTKAAPLEVQKMEAKRPGPGWLRRQMDRVRHWWNKSATREPAPAP